MNRAAGHGEDWHVVMALLKLLENGYDFASGRAEDMQATLEADFDPQQTQMSQQRYVAYLLRLWLSDNADQPVWRGSLENPHTGNRIGFSDAQSLLAHLRRQTEIPSSAPDDAEA
jgi:hypothetical protein